jgi:hypothetical protein
LLTCKRRHILTYFQRKIKKNLIADYAGNFGVVKGCSLDRIEKQEKGGIMAKMKNGSCSQFLQKMNAGKINNILCVIWLVIGISFFISGCPFKSWVEGKAWFRYALKFDEARSETIANEIAGKKSALQDLAKMEKMKQKFLRAEQPTEAEIISVLRSPNRKFQRVGLAAMSLKLIETDQLIDILFEFLQDQDNNFRWYAKYSLDDFAKFPESKKAGLGRQLLEIIKKEKDEGLSIAEFSLLAKFPSEEAVRFLTEQLMKEGEGKENLLYRHFAFKALKEMGDSYYDEAAEYVNKHGSPEIKKELLKEENSWKEWEKINILTGKE